MSKGWKKGRGKLGILQPLLGSWVAEADSPMGQLRCTRTFEESLGGSIIKLQAQWKFGSAAAASDPKTAAMIEKYKKSGPYEELAIFAPGDEGKVSFWSFTSDGKRSQGVVADVSDVHKEAIGFEAQMPAGLARMIYWPADDGFFWVVESKSAKGWNRFTEHHYRPA